MNEPRIACIERKKPPLTDADSIFKSGTQGSLQAANLPAMRISRANLFRDEALAFAKNCEFLPANLLPDFSCAFKSKRVLARTPLVVQPIKLSAET